MSLVGNGVKISHSKAVGQLGGLLVGSTVNVLHDQPYTGGLKADTDMSASHSDRTKKRDRMPTDPISMSYAQRKCDD